jgi:hypothetical protein
VGICEALTPKIVRIPNKSPIAMGKKKDEREALKLELAAGVAGSTTATNISSTGGKVRCMQNP